MTKQKEETLVSPAELYIEAKLIVDGLQRRYGDEVLCLVAEILAARVSWK